MTAIGTLSKPVAVASASRRVRAGRRSLAWALAHAKAIAVFSLLTAAYFSAGAYMALHYSSVAPDALARTGLAHGMVTGSTTGIPAMGFVWSPLPTLVVLPFVPLMNLWPEIATKALAMSAISAAATAGSVLLLAAIARRLGVGRGGAFVIAGLYALHPVVVVQAANGFTEALFGLLLLAAIDALMKWRSPPMGTEANPIHLSLAGGFAGLAYLTRYEAGAGAIGLVVAVAFVSWLRARRRGADRSRRNHEAFADAVLVAGPIAFCGLVFALFSLAIVGHPFEIFVSEYGNTSQVGAASDEIAKAIGRTPIDRAWFVLRQDLLLVPALAVGAPLAAWLSWRRQDGRLFLPVALLAPIWAFQAWGAVSATTFAILRFQFAVVPLAFVGAAGITAMVAERRAERTATVGDPGRRGFGIVGVAVALAAGALVTTPNLLSPTLAREEAEYLAPLAMDLGAGRPAIDTWERRFETETVVADHLDALGLGTGEIIGDQATMFPVLLNVAEPEIFITTTDRGFADALEDPRRSGLRYLLVANDELGLDAVGAAVIELREREPGALRVAERFAPAVPGAKALVLYEVVGNTR